MKYKSNGEYYLVLLLILRYTTAQSEFTYENKEDWAVEYPQCKGTQQSPIKLSFLEAIQADLPPLTFMHYDIEFSQKLTLINAGTTIRFSIPETKIGYRPAIWGSLLRSYYEAEQVHFHWGSESSKGSEHYINGHNFDMEMHIVHKNVKYTTFKEAFNFPDGIVVLAVLFKVINSSKNPALNTIYQNIDQILKYNSSSTMNTYVSLGSLLGDLNKSEFYTYNGSLTTPPCAEAVTWHVFSDILPISDTEMMKFWKVSDSKGRKIVNNFRLPQPINSRPIFFNSHPH